MTGLLVTKRISLYRTAEDWELSHTQSPASHQAAREINEAIETAFNDGKSQSAVYKSALAVMQKHSDLGAMDSEPLYQLDRLMEELYGK